MNDPQKYSSRPWYLKNIPVVGAFLAGAVLVPLFKEIIVFSFNTAIVQPDFSITASACSTLVKAERKIVGSKSGREFDTNMNFPSQAYVVFRNDGNKAIEAGQYAVILNGADNASSKKPELLLMDISGSTIGALGDIENPEISNEGSMITFDHAALNPGEEILIELTVLGPVKIYTEARKTGLTHTHTIHPGCADSGSLSKSLKYTNWIGGTTNYINSKYCADSKDPNISKGVECKFKFKSETFSIPNDFDYRDQMQGTFDLQYDKNPAY